MEQFNYAYLAGLIDGEGSFIIAMSPRKRKTGTYSIALYQWFTISQSHPDGKNLMEELNLWLTKEGIRSFLMTPIKNKFNNSLSYTLRIAHLDSLIKLCNRLNGKLILKQEALANFLMVLQIRKERRQKKPSLKGHKFPPFSKQCEEFYRTVAIIWDNFRGTLHHRLWKKSMEERLNEILDRKTLPK